MSRPNFSEKARAVMFDWLSRHLDHPYPSVKEKEHFARTLDLNMTQINTWFVNARKRYIHNIDSSDPSDPSDSSDSSDSSDPSDPSDQLNINDDQSKSLPDLDSISLSPEEIAPILLEWFRQCSFDVLIMFLRWSMNKTELGVLVDGLVSEFLFETLDWRQYLFVMEFVSDRVVPLDLLCYITTQMVGETEEHICVDLLHHSILHRRHVFTQALLQAGVPPVGLFLPNGTVLTFEDLIRIGK